ncbi:hypothetical protein DYQ86_02215 [Acidobacteria bacterium AB60]|nr:hypothetical protein DYQ86_02215 [Acidobacteria bacterium AB60]
MGSTHALEIDAWLREGGVVVTASERAARALAGTYHRERLREGKTAWTSPEILSWPQFVRRAWEHRSQDGRFLLNHLQERALWTDIVAAGGHAAATLAPSRQRLSAMAMDAHALLCSYAPRFLEARARRAWTGDAAAFSDWLARFDTTCAQTGSVSENAVPLELVAMLNADGRPRAPLLLAGFDRVLPVQQTLFEAWGTWKRIDEGRQRSAMRLYQAGDREAELTACTTWCKNQLASDPEARLLVITQDVASRRGEIERAFLASLGSKPPLAFEFSLGVPLAQTAMARSAILLLRFLDGALEEHELDWLISTGHGVASAFEADALQARMRDLRRHKRQRTHWKMQAFLQQFAKPAAPAAWEQRMRTAQQRLQAASHRARSPLEWAELAPQVLAATGWPGESGPSSANFQALRRLRQVIDVCGSLGFDGRQISWREFAGELEGAAEETLFAPESQDPSILIAGPAESAGLTADAIWFLGASEEAWPARGNMHPLLPAPVQRDAGMPHSSPRDDWDLARAISGRLAASAEEICFSYARQVEGTDVGASRVILQLAGAPALVPAELAGERVPAPLATIFDDDYSIPLPRTGFQESGDGLTIRGGARFLTMQSQCAFRAVATSRLGAEDWEGAEAGLTAAVRGQLLHAVMHAIWGGPPLGIRTLEQLRAIADRRAFVEERVREVMRDEVPDSAREQMPGRYLELEVKRLTRLITEWLDYEATRLPFTVVATEVKSVAAVGDARLELRLDRIDQLNDGSLLVVDYKSGDMKTRVWETPRPEDVQLPLYAGFGLEPDGVLGGLAFAKIRAGDASFAGRIGNALATLGEKLPNAAALGKSQLTAEQLLDWREEILRLMREYLEGRADVNPRDPKTTCDRCGLHVLCRIQERPVTIIEEEEEAEEEDE